MIEQLERLLVLRTLRENKVHAELARRRHVRDEIADELATLDEQRRQIEQQHKAWESQWRRWLAEDGVLHHGQEYNLYHVKLSAWRREIEGQRTVVESRYRLAEQELLAARAQLVKRKRQSEVIRSELNAAQKALRMYQEDIEEAHAIEELVSHRCARRVTSEFAI
jgi:hypothetical protein